MSCRALPFTMALKQAGALALRRTRYWRIGVRGAARAETRFHFRTGITSVVAWLVVSAYTSAWRALPPREHCSFAHQMRLRRPVSGGPSGGKGNVSTR
jgi:hypothetical protein